MLFLQIETSWWVVVDDVTRPRFIVHHGPTVDPVTRETLFRYRIDRWQLERTQRRTETLCDTLSESAEWCRAQLDDQRFQKPHIDPAGGVITVEEQRRRAAAGLETRTGIPKQPHADLSHLVALQAGVLRYDDTASRWAEVVNAPDTDELEIVRSDLVAASHLLAAAARRILGQTEPADVALLPRL